MLKIRSNYRSNVAKLIDKFWFRKINDITQLIVLI
jgi:hypothetical protein